MPALDRDAVSLAAAHALGVDRPGSIEAVKRWRHAGQAGEFREGEITEPLRSSLALSP